MKAKDSIKQGFDGRAAVYDVLSKINPIVIDNRQTVYHHINRYLKPGDNILEINAGTGVDGEYFAKRGFNIVCTDFSSKMLQRAQQRALHYPNMSVQNLSYHKIDQVDNAPFNYVFSNLGGLNLSADLNQVFRKLDAILNPGGYITVVLLSQLCIWELLNVFWSPSVAFRRVPSWFGKGVMTNVSGRKMITYYHSTKKISRWLGNGFTLMDIQSLSVFIPPSYYETIPQRFSKAFEFLKKVDHRLNRSFPFTKLGDFKVLTYQKVIGD